MRQTFILLLGLILVLGVIAVAEDPQPMKKAVAWIDTENCAFCKHLTAQEGLMDHMTWEYHDIANGCVAITTVDPGYKAAYIKANEAMEKVSKELESGQRTMAETPMCGLCTAFSGLTQAGAKFDHVQGANADIVVITSDKPETQKAIKEFSERNRTELAAWKAECEAKAKEKAKTE